MNNGIIITCQITNHFETFFVFILNKTVLSVFNSFILVFYLDIGFQIKGIEFRDEISLNVNGKLTEIKCKG